MQAIDFATRRELLGFFAKNQIRASYCLLAFSDPDALGLTRPIVDARFRTLQTLHDLGGWLYEVGCKAGVDELELSQRVADLWPAIVEDSGFPTQTEVDDESGNS